MRLSALRDTAARRAEAVPDASPTIPSIAAVRRKPASAIRWAAHVANGSCQPSARSSGDSLARRFARMKPDFDEPIAFGRWPGTAAAAADRRRRRGPCRRTRRDARFPARRSAFGTSRQTRASPGPAATSRTPNPWQHRVAQQRRLPRHAHRLDAEPLHQFRHDFGHGRKHLDVLMAVEVRRPQAVVADELQPAAASSPESPRGTCRPTAAAGQTARRRRESGLPRRAIRPDSGRRQAAGLA